LSPHAILARLQAHEPFVLRGVPDLPARHRSLHAAVRWSFDLLDATERLVFLRCGIFSGSIGAVAIAALDEPPGQLVDPLGVLAQLADKNLLQVVDPASDTPRFRMLETIRAFALAEGADQADLRRRYAMYFVAYAERAAGALRGHTMGEALDSLEREYDNFRGVLNWSLNDGEVSVGLRLAGALYRFWMLRGHLAEARHWFERALPRGQNVAIDVRARALNAAGVVAGLQGDNRAAEALFDESFRLWQMLGDPIPMAAAMGNLGLVAQDRHDMARALDCFQSAERLYAKGGDRRGIAVSLGSRGRLARQEGSILEAVTLFKQALAQFREVEDPRGIANTLANLGHVMLALKEPEQSIPYFVEALELRGTLGNTLGIAECLEGFAGVAVATGRPRHAARLLGAAGALREITGSPLPETDRKQFEWMVGRIRDRLDPEAFASEQAAGRELSPEQAAHYALLLEAEPAASVADGHRSAPAPLTERERDVAELIARGLTNPQIADMLHVTRRTVGTHLEHIFAKLGVQARSEVAVWITRQESHDAIAHQPALPVGEGQQLESASAGHNDPAASDDLAGP
jgi:DNA-binding CsgD family transcriptional regulator